MPHTHVCMCIYVVQYELLWSFEKLETKLHVELRCIIHNIYGICIRMSLYIPVGMVAHFMWLLMLLACLCLHFSLIRNVFDCELFADIHIQSFRCLFKKPRQKSIANCIHEKKNPTLWSRVILSSLVWVCYLCMYLTSSSFLNHHSRNVLFWCLIPQKNSCAA